MQCEKPTTRELIFKLYLVESPFLLILMGKKLFHILNNKISLFTPF